MILGLAVLFLVWLANTALRHISRIRFDEEGLHEHSLAEEGHRLERTRGDGAALLFYAAQT